jgi:drug/metabolite transporter (DMT)-like permease
VADPGRVHRDGRPHGPGSEHRDARHGQTIIAGVTRRHLALLVVGVTAVSFSAVFVRLADAPPFAVAFYRCAFAAAVLVPLALARHRSVLRRLTRRDVTLVVASGVLLAAHFASWIPSITLTTVAASAVLVQTMPVWVAILGRFVGERPARGTALGIAVALAGVAVIAVAAPGSGDGDVAQHPLLGDLLALLGALFAALYFLIGRRLRPVLPLVPYTAVVYAIAAAVLAVVMVVGGTPFTGYPVETWALFVGITIGPQFLGHTVFNYLLAHVRTSVVSVALLAEPVGATILAFLILGEVPPPATVVGGAVVLAGVFLAIRAEARAGAAVLEAPLE